MMKERVLKTVHQYINENSNHMRSISDGDVDLIVTSPPYPMIEMWDALFFEANPEIKRHYLKGEVGLMFEAMHKILDLVWMECFRVLKNGGFLCVNIGDATRTVNENFHLFSNHSRILTHLIQTGFTVLPAIIWRKQTNAPNKFMGSGMLPAGAYVTLEHEYILILRKGGKRKFIHEEEKENRHESAIFWEERNIFFSDVWMDLKGARQRLGNEDGRKRSGAFPFELAYRLINMYSVKGDLVLDPFMGTGTTLFAAMTANRNSIGYEIDANLSNILSLNESELISFANSVIAERLANHARFVETRIEKEKPFKHQNIPYGFPVVTNQEKKLLINSLKGIKKANERMIEVFYEDKPVIPFHLLNRSVPTPVDGNENENGKLPKKNLEKSSLNQGGFTQRTLF